MKEEVVPKGWFEEHLSGILGITAFMVCAFLFIMLIGAFDSGCFRWSFDGVKHSICTGENAK